LVNIISPWQFQDLPEESAISYHAGKGPRQLGSVPVAQDAMSKRVE
jgi:hypothetical protein